MKTLRWSLFVILMVCCRLTLNALSPIPRASIEERVAQASHIFIGRVISSTPNTDYSLFGGVKYSVTVENVLFPSGWYVHGEITIEEMGLEADGVVGDSYVFTVKQRAASGSFDAPTGRGLKVEMEKKPEIIRALYIRLWGRDRVPEAWMPKQEDKK